jgi:hypothetical protein
MDNTEENTIMNKENLKKKCTILNTVNNIVKIYYYAGRQMEFFQVPGH